MADDAPASLAYFDNNATTPLLPAVREAMAPWLGGHHGNPSSAHRAGREARRAVEEARAAVAALLGAEPADVVFTASGTEANVTVIDALAEAAGHRGEVVVSALEHPSIAGAAARAAARGMRVVTVAPGPDGVVAATAVEATLGPATRLVCLMLASNVVGTLQPVSQVAARCRARGVPLLCDAVQAAGKVPVDVAALGADYVTLGAHKLHGPLGAAALWARPGAAYAPLLVGAGQEGGRRAGTENVPAIVGFGEAARLAHADLDARRRHLGGLRDRFEAALAARRDVLGEVVVHGAGAPRLPSTSHVAFPGLSGADLAARLDAAGFAVSTGPACHDGRPQPSPALLAMGVAASEALASLRVSFGALNHEGEVDALVAALESEVPAASGRTR